MSGRGAMLGLTGEAAPPPTGQAPVFSQIHERGSLSSMSPRTWTGVLTPTSAGDSVVVILFGSSQSLPDDDYTVTCGGVTGTYIGTARRNNAPSGSNLSAQIYQLDNIPAGQTGWEVSHATGGSQGGSFNFLVFSGVGGLATLHGVFYNSQGAPGPYYHADVAGVTAPDTYPIAIYWRTSGAMTNVTVLPTNYLMMLDPGGFNHMSLRWDDVAAPNPSPAGERAPFETALDRFGHGWLLTVPGT